MTIVAHCLSSMLGVALIIANFLVAPTASQCVAGQYTNGTSCVDCVAGKYQNNPSLSICQSCPIGFYSPALNATSLSLCLKCEGGTTNVVGATDQSFCFCSPGYYGSPPSGIPCKSCSKRGIMCPFENMTLPMVREGYYRLNSDSARICLPKSSCETTYLNVNTSCSVGYTGIGCSNCVDGYYRQELDCVYCPPVGYRILSVILLTGVLIFVLSRLTSSNGRLSVELRIAIQSIQIVALYSRFLSNWPPFLLQFFSFLSFAVRYFIKSFQLIEFCRTSILIFSLWNAQYLLTIGQNTT
jgi:hypothetical protein